MEGLSVLSKAKMGWYYNFGENFSPPGAGRLHEDQAYYVNPSENGHPTKTECGIKTI